MKLTVTSLYDRIKDDSLDRFLLDMIKITCNKSIVDESSQYSSTTTEGTKMHSVMITEWKNFSLLTKYTTINNDSLREYPIEITFMNHTIVGTPDVINLHEIIDYKCGGMFEKGHLSYRYLFQLQMYAFMVHSSLGRTINRIVLFNPIGNHIVKMTLNSRFISSFKKMLSGYIQNLTE